MRVANMLPEAQYQMQQSQQALSAALQQLSTGLRVNQLSDDPSASANMVASLAESANVDQYTSNVTTVTGQMETADSALSAVVTSVTSAVTLGTEAANGTSISSNKQSIATELQGILNSVVGQANATYQGAYLFGGTASTTVPFVAASSSYTSANGSLTNTTPLTAGSITISDASTGQSLVFDATGKTVNDLENAVSNAVSAGTLSAGTTATINGSGQLVIGTNSSSNGIVVTSSDSALGSMTADPNTAVANAYAYNGNNGVNQVQVGDALSIATNIPGSQLFGSGTGLIASLTNLISAVQNGTSDQIGAATSAVSAALSQFNTQRIPLDNNISQLNSQESYLSKETVTLKTEQTALVGISMAIAATNVSQAELTNNAVLAAASKVLPQTLLDYLK